MLLLHPSINPLEYGNTKVLTTWGNQLIKETSKLLNSGRWLFSTSFNYNCMYLFMLGKLYILSIFLKTNLSSYARCMSSDIHNISSSFTRSLSVNLSGFFIRILWLYLSILECVTNFFCSRLRTCSRV